MSIMMSTRLAHNPNAIHRTHPILNSEGIAMANGAMWGLAAAATILLAIFVVRGVPPADPATEATIGAAQRYQAPQIGAKDVVVGDTSTQAVMQSETWDRIVKDEALRTLLLNDSFRAQLQEALRNNDFRAQLADPRIAAALAGAAFQNASRRWATRGFPRPWRHAPGATTRGGAGPTRRSSPLPGSTDDGLSVRPPTFPLLLCMSIKMHRNQAPGDARGPRSGEMIEQDQPKPSTAHTRTGRVR
jgi:hypothetical protein